jgi:hypothetical protein
MTCCTRATSETLRAMGPRLPRGIWDRDAPFVDPRADRLIGEFLGVGDEVASGILDAYNCSDL